MTIVTTERSLEPQPPPAVKPAPVEPQPAVDTKPSTDGMLIMLLLNYIMVLLHNIYNYCIYTLNLLILCSVLCNCKCLLIDHIAGSLQRDQLYLRTLEEHIRGSDHLVMMLFHC